MPRGGRLKSGLVIPKSVASVLPPAYVCRVIVDEAGQMCGQQFTEDQAGDYQRHVTKCARANLQFIQAQSKAVRMPGFFGPEAGDPEMEQWVRENRTALIEGRKSLTGRRPGGGRARRRGRSKR